MLIRHYLLGIILYCCLIVKSYIDLLTLSAWCAKNFYVSRLGFGPPWHVTESAVQYPRWWPHTAQVVLSSEWMHSSPHCTTVLHFYPHVTRRKQETKQTVEPNGKVWFFVLGHLIKGRHRWQWEVWWWETTVRVVVSFQSNFSTSRTECARV